MFGPIPCLVKSWTDDGLNEPATFYGLIANNEGGLEAIIRRSGSPILDSVHPSRIILQEPGQQLPE